MIEQSNAHIFRELVYLDSFIALQSQGEFTCETANLPSYMLQVLTVEFDLCDAINGKPELQMGNILCIYVFYNATCRIPGSIQYKQLG